MPILPVSLPGDYVKTSAGLPLLDAETKTKPANLGRDYGDMCLAVDGYRTCMHTYIHAYIYCPCGDVSEGMYVCTCMYVCAGFAQVFPEHKYLIVECLRELGYKVGMTGDGVCIYVCMYEIMHYMYVCVAATVAACMYVCMFV